MPQRDWLPRLRYSRRPSWMRPERRVPSVASQNPAEVLEPRCLLTFSMSAVPTSAAASLDAGSTDVNDSARDDLASTDVGTADGETAAKSPYFSQAELRDYLLKLAQQRFGGLFGQTIPQYLYDYRWLAVDSGVVGLTAADGVRTDNKSASSQIQSDTNNQVAGVDEADFVETDGRYIYVARGGGLTIIDTQSSSTSNDDSHADPSVAFDGPMPTHWHLSVASKRELSGNVVGEFLFHDRLTVISQSYDAYYAGLSGRPLLNSPGFRPIRANPQTIVTVFDVSDRT